MNKYKYILAPVSKYASPSTVIIYANTAEEAEKQLTAAEKARIIERKQ